MKFQALAILASCQLALTATTISKPFEESLRKRQATNSSAFPLQVDLGYSIYEGVTNATSGINLWSGIRFAAPPIGALRWQAPQPPTFNRSAVIQANETPNQCPQSYPNIGNQAEAVELINTLGGSEDCLFLNVFAPENAQNLPVLVWIHGGGYGFGNGREDLTDIIATNNNSFIGVTIQYRLGAFGFLSSDEVNRFGVVNAGIRDQTFALQWVQSYIHLFGGNASAVTISGESAGGGSVMLQSMAYGGTLGQSLFTNAITASPYLPMQYKYNDWVPSQSYYSFANAAGCMVTTAAGSPSTSKIFDCLVSQDTAVLKNASAAISASGAYGTWGFLPVTDGKFIQDVPSKQLQQKRVNGLRVLSGNNADEGEPFVPQNITSVDDLVTWLQETFPLFTTDDISKVLRYYPNSNNSDSMSSVEFATLGNIGPTAINQSAVATGQQQRANNIYAETTFVCPSYWMAEAYTNEGRVAYKYQYSVPAAIHAADVSGYFGPASPVQGPDFLRAFMTIWGNFINQNNPSISAAIAVGSSPSNSTLPENPITAWPAYTNANPYMINLNETGGTAVEVTVNSFEGVPVNATEHVGPGLMNDITLVNAFTWEGGRGVRCDFWRAVSGLVPE